MVDERPVTRLDRKSKSSKVAPDLLAAYAKNSTDRLNGVKDANLSKGAVIYQSLCIGSTGPTAKASTPARDRSLRRWPALRSPTATKPS